MTEDVPTNDITLTETAEVVAGLSSPSLVPPPSPATLQPGPTATVRAAMARFSSGAEHERRRLEVLEAIERVDPSAVGHLAAEETAMLLQTNEPIDAVADIAFVAPTRALVRAIEPTIEPDALGRITTDVAAMVSVIGRGARSSAEVDAAVFRLADRFSVEALSMLYQNHDATAALVAARLVARASGDPMRSPLAKTVRVATEPVSIGGHSITDGQMVIVGIEGAVETWFGAGPHRCPGEELAGAIAAAVVDAIDRSDHQITADAIAYGDDGRAVAIPLALNPREKDVNR